MSAARLPAEMFKPFHRFIATPGVLLQ